MQAGVNPLNSKIFFKKLRKPLDDRFLLFRAVAAAKAGDGRQDLVNIRAGRFERAVAERIGNKALRFCGLQLFFRDDLFQLRLLLPQKGHSLCSEPNSHQGSQVPMP